MALQIGWIWCSGCSNRMLYPAACMARIFGRLSFSLWVMLGTHKLQVQRHHLCFLRRLVEVRNRTCRWPLLYELGQVPFFFYWWKAAVKLWSKILVDDNPLMTAALESDVLLADHSTCCWTSHLRDGLASLVEEADNAPGFPLVDSDGVSLLALDSVAVQKTSLAHLLPAVGTFASCYIRMFVWKNWKRESMPLTACGFDIQMTFLLPCLSISLRMD